MVLEGIHVNDVILGNKALLKSLPVPGKRAEFMASLDKEPFDELVDRLIPIASKKGFKQWCYQSFKNIHRIVKATSLHPKPLFQFLKYNFSLRISKLHGGRAL